MQLTRFTDLGLRTMMLLAAGDAADRRVTIRTVAAAAGASEHHIAKAVARLVDLDMVNARRGRIGGLSLTDAGRTVSRGLAHPPARRRRRGHRLRRRSPCPLIAGCRLRRALADAKEAFYRELDHHTLDDLSGSGLLPIVTSRCTPRKDHHDDRSPPPTEDDWSPRTPRWSRRRCRWSGRTSTRSPGPSTGGSSTHHPALLRNLFNRGNQAQGAQQRALAASIATFATHLVDPDLPHPAELLSRIGHKHASLGVTADQYPVVHEHLFAAIVEVLGADIVTAEVAEAWDRVYWIMAQTLIDLERDALRRGRGEPTGDVYRRGAGAGAGSTTRPARSW